MMLLDTIVLSELRKRRPRVEVVTWLKAHEDRELFLSVVSVGEIERGIEKRRLVDPPFAATLSQWPDDLLGFYADRILPITPGIARRWGALSARIGNEGADLLIAATALHHGLTVATRNVRHFTPTGVPTVNPFGD